MILCDVTHDDCDVELWLQGDNEFFKLLKSIPYDQFRVLMEVYIIPYLFSQHLHQWHIKSIVCNSVVSHIGAPFSNKEVINVYGLCYEPCKTCVFYVPGESNTSLQRDKEIMSLYQIVIKL